MVLEYTINTNKTTHSWTLDSSLDLHVYSWYISRDKWHNWLLTRVDLYMITNNAYTIQQSVTTHIHNRQHYGESCGISHIRMS